MDTRQLKTLATIATHGTFARAADIVHLTPSAVSQQIQTLEQELGATLFERSSRPPKLTSQGLQVLELARTILRLEEDTKASLRGDLISGTLMLGTVRTSGLSLLPQAIVKMRRQYPGLTINLHVGQSTQMIQDVASGKLDAAIVAEHTGVPPTLRWSPFLREPLLMIAPTGTAQEPVAKMLETLPYIRFQSSVPLANLIDTELSRLKIAPINVAVIDNISSIVTCVRQGLGVSVVPQVALQEITEDELLRLPFGEPQVTRQIGLVERTVAPREEIIARLHGILTDLCGTNGVPRR